MEGQIPDEVKTERMKRLLDLQKQIMSEIAKSYEGTVQEVLVEETKGEDQVIGRTTTNKWATLKGDKGLLGKLVKVKVLKASPFNLDCELLEVIR